MKTLNQLFLAIAFTLSTISMTNAADVPALDDEGNRIEAVKAAVVYNIFGTADKKIHVILRQANANVTTVKIFDAELNLVFSESQKGAELNKKYDLSALNAGVYLVTVTNGDFQTARLVNVGEVEGQNFVAQISEVQAEMLRVSFENANASVVISISDDEGNELYNKTLEGKASSAAFYSFSELSAGRYWVKVICGKTEVEKYIQID